MNPSTNLSTVSSGVKEGVSQIFKQLDTLLAQMSQDEYTLPLSLFNQSSIGQHTRHILDFFSILAKTSPDCIVNYDKRKRNPNTETDVAFARKQIEKLDYFVNDMEDNYTLRVQGHYMSSSNTFSCLEREIGYCIEHAIHHMALIKVGILSAFPHIKLENSFGVAPSTIEYKLSVNQSVEQS